MHTPTYMKKLLLILTTLTLTITALAQAVWPVDWRYDLYWTDPNPPGLVARWYVYATNAATMGSERRVTATTTTQCELQTLLMGLPAGNYTLYTTAVSQLDSEGDPGDMIVVSWPGGDGKLKGGKNPNAHK